MQDPNTCQPRMRSAPRSVACGRPVAARIMRVNALPLRIARPARASSSTSAPPPAPPPSAAAAPPAEARTGMIAPPAPFVVAGRQRRPPPATVLAANINFVNNLKKLDHQDQIKAALKEFNGLVLAVRHSTVACAGLHRPAHACISFFVLSDTTSSSSCCVLD